MGFVITKTKLIVVGAAVLILVGGLLLVLPNIQDGIPAPLYFTTRNSINRLEAGLAAFYSDFGDYPPSDKEHMAAQPFGFQNIAYYLLGPEGKGWGGEAGGAMPFGGTNEKTFGPYFERDSKDLRLHPVAPVSDALQPPKPILYFRAEPTENPVFDAADNPHDPTGREGFASQEHLEMLARRADGQWARRDYLLISAGPDRLFGYVVEDKASDGFRPARPEEKEKASCDDIVNFKY